MGSGSGSETPIDGPYFGLQIDFLKLGSIFSSGDCHELTGK